MEIFLVRVKELNFFEDDSWNWTLFFEYDLKNWTYFQYDSKYWFFSNKNFDSKNSTSFFLNMTQRTEPFFSDWKNWILIMTLRTQLFSNVTKNCFFFERYSKNLTLFILSSKIEPFSLIRLHELNHSLIRLKDFVFENDSKNQKFWIWLKELNFFLNVIQIFFHKDSKHWTLLFNMTHRIEPFCSIWLKELNHRTFQNDLMN